MLGPNYKKPDSCNLNNTQQGLWGRQGDLGYRESWRVIAYGILRSKINKTLIRMPIMVLERYIQSLDFRCFLVLGLHWSRDQKPRLSVVIWAGTIDSDQVKRHSSSF